ncbi:class I SAM-dependent RNA methyltransferase [Synoicihabitans lomoniglobus]|uniref:class I SAM-dependent RNA methyltransferase n=1 Tax=Synoicihabitans lomoniglobus TaxID=2909285 RepID=UPI0031F31663
MCSVGRKKQKQPRDFPFPYHAEIELEITTLTNRGIGLGRVPLPRETSSLSTSPEPESSGAWVVMVPFCLPGERVRARVFRNQKNFSEADLVEVLTASPERIAPPCEFFGRCGGCQYQHFTYDGQLAWKRQQVVELLQHMADIEHPVNPVIGSPEQFGYRSKITPHFQLPRDGQSAEDLPIGFLRQGTRFDIVDVPRCLIATDAINERLHTIRPEVRAKVAAGGYKKGATLLLRDASGTVTTDYDTVVTETVGDLQLHFLARDFFQNNPFILPAFTGYVREQAAASGARHLVDAYCGSGLFALTAASAFEQVQGIEISESSVRFATENAAANDITNATFQAGDASAIFAGLTFPADDTVIIIDPPRKGCDEVFLNQLFDYGPKAVIYVSCDPATQMRDLVHFKTAGYTLTDVQPFDLFPQTRHLECVVTLRR